MSSIFNYPEDSLPWVKETIFKEVFLPGFIERNRDLNLRWIKEIAINPYARVRVVDDRDTTKVLFVVPPFLTGVEETKVNLSSASNHFGKILDAGYGAKAANKFLRSTIGEGIVDHRVDEEDINAWQEILARYGYDEVKKEKGVRNDTSGLVDEEEEFG